MMGWRNAAPAGWSPCSGDRRGAGGRSGPERSCTPDGWATPSKPGGSALAITSPREAPCSAATARSSAVPHSSSSSRRSGSPARHQLTAPCPTPTLSASRCAASSGAAPGRSAARATPRWRSSAHAAAAASASGPSNTAVSASPPNLATHPPARAILRTSGVNASTRAWCRSSAPPGPRGASASPSAVNPETSANNTAPSPWCETSAGSRPAHSCAATGYGTHGRQNPGPSVEGRSVEGRSVEGVTFRTWTRR